MPRRAGVRKRDVLPDFVYNSKIVTKLVNQVMLDGKKAIAEGRTIPAREINHPLIERLKAKALAEGRELKPQPIINERIKALIKKSKNATKEE